MHHRRPRSGRPRPGVRNSVAAIAHGAPDRLSRHPENPLPTAVPRPSRPRLPVALRAFAPPTRAPTSCPSPNPACCPSSSTSARPPAPVCRRCPIWPTTASSSSSITRWKGSRARCAGRRTRRAATRSGCRCPGRGRADCRRNRTPRGSHRGSRSARRCCSRRGSPNRCPALPSSRPARIATPPTPQPTSPRWRSPPSRPRRPSHSPRTSTAPRSSGS